MDILRFITCGSVDDGKSTLIGRLLYDSKQLSDEQSAAIEVVSSMVTYGWGAIPVKARIGRTDFTTSLFPKGELYLVPIKDAVRRAEGLTLGDEVTVQLRLDA